MFVGCVELITVKTPEKYVNVTVGESILLQCTFVTDEETGKLIIKWDFVPSSSMVPEQVHTHTHIELYKNISYANLLMFGGRLNIVYSIKRTILIFTFVSV